MKSLYSKILNFGVDESLEYLEVRRVRMVNGVALVGGMVWFLLSIMVLAVGFIFPALIDLTGAVSCFGALYLNKKRKYNGAFYALSFGGLLCLNFISITFGRESAAHFGILIWIVMTLFIMRRPKLSILLASVGVISLTVLEYIFNNFEPLAKPAEDDKLAHIFQYGLLPASLGVIIMIIHFFRREIRSFERSLRKKNEQLSEQKEEIEQQHQEIKDSIEYARRIQAAILPSHTVLNDLLPKSFVLYKPKDVVAGDFYWVEEVDGQVLFAAADCTGHGVPGAMISVICNGALNRSVREFGNTDPGKILDKTRELVINEFKKSEEEVRDGMDIALVSLFYDRSSSASREAESGPFDSAPSDAKDLPTALQGSKATLKYSGAHNPLWIIRKVDGKPENEENYLSEDGKFELFEIKANKQPIGRYEMQNPYDTHEVKVNSGDSIYVFTDGFTDQFGGLKGKKFKSANLKKLLLSLQSEPMRKQRKILDQAFEDWRGGLEQIDDVCIIGVQV